jgi:drug/metabolite transporter (DMT)-like permease
MTLIFSAHYLAARAVLATVPALALGAGRGLAGGLLLALIFRRELKEAVQARPLPWILLPVGALGFGLNQILLFQGLLRAPAADAALIANAIPMLSTTCAALLGVERVRGRQILGLALGFAAVTAFALRGGLAAGARRDGDLLIVANVAAFAFAVALAKKTLAGVSPPVLTTAMLLSGGLILAAAAGFDLAPLWSYAARDAQAAALVAFELLITTAAGYLLNMAALSRLSVAQTTAFSHFQPLLTAGLAAALIGIPVEWGPMALALLLVAAANVLLRR